MKKIGILLLAGLTGLAGTLGLLYYSLFPQATFSATITDVWASSINVEVAVAVPGVFLEGEPLFVTIGDSTRIVDESGNKITVADLQVGDTVVILFDGSIAESYPAQIHRCFQIRIVG